MGKETRVFFQIIDANNTPCYDKPPCIWNVLKQKINPLKGERRTDVYYQLHSTKYGLKFRGGSQLELKTRVEKLESGVEVWDKQILYHGKSKNSPSLSELGSIIPKRAQNELLHQLMETYAASSQKLTFIETKKLRTQRVLSPWSLGSTLVEQADVRVFLIEEGKSNVYLGTWRSICFEDGEEDVLRKSLDKTIAWLTEQGVINIQEVAYPEWMSQLSRPQQNPSSL